MTLSIIYIGTAIGVAAEAYTRHIKKRPEDRGGSTVVAAILLGCLWPVLFGNVLVHISESK